jgi:hypothetical protein
MTVPEDRHGQTKSIASKSHLFLFVLCSFILLGSYSLQRRHVGPTNKTWALFCYISFLVLFIINVSPSFNASNPSYDEESAGIKETTKKNENRRSLNNLDDDEKFKKRNRKQPTSMKTDQIRVTDRFVYPVATLRTTSPSLMFANVISYMSFDVLL